MLCTEGAFASLDGVMGDGKVVVFFDDDGVACILEEEEVPRISYKQLRPKFTHSTIYMAGIRGVKYSSPEAQRGCIEAQGRG